MDMNSIAEFFKTYVLEHWPFLVVSGFLGAVGGFMKKQVWTKDRARKTKFSYWMRATLPFHAAFAGGAIGLLGFFIFGEDMPASLDIERTAASMMFYYGGAGAMASWTYAAWKHFMKSRGITSEQIEMPSKYPEKPL